MQNRYKCVLLNGADSAAVALEDIPADTHVRVACEGVMHEVRLLEAIPFGHKFAVMPIARGEDILKYGEVIGRALADIAVGEHVHVHNLEGNRGRGDRLAENA